MTRFRKSVPPNVAAAVAKALEKLPADRFESAKAFAEALGNEGFRFTTVASAGAAVERDGASEGGAAFAAGGAVGAGAGGHRVHRLAGDPPRSGTGGIDLGVGACPTASPWGPSVEAGSPFRAMVPAWQSSARHQDGAVALYLRRADDPVAQLVRGSEGEPTPSGYTPRFSPDGEWLIFATTDGIKKVPVAGGTAQTIDESGLNPSWGDGGRVVFVRGGDLWTGSAEGRMRGRSRRRIPPRGVSAQAPPHRCLAASTRSWRWILHRRLARGRSVDSLHLGWYRFRIGSIT